MLNDYFNPDGELFQTYITDYTVQYGAWDRRTYHIDIDRWNALGDFHKIQDEHLACILMPFLIIWGKIRAVQSWEGEQIPRLKDFFEKNSERLIKFRELDLESVNLPLLRLEISEIYQDFNTIPQIAQTTLSKILHLTCPTFFPILDELIRKRLGLKERDTDYFRFMELLKEQFLTSKEYRHFIETSMKDRPRSKIKIIDEYLWLRAKRENKDKKGKHRE